MTKIREHDSDSLLISLLSLVEARLLSLLFVIVGLLLLVAYLFAGWSPPRWLLLVLTAGLASVPFGLVTGFAAKSQLSSTDWVYLIDLDARVLDGAVYRMPPHHLAQFDILEGELSHLGPSLYVGKQVNLDELTAKGTWRGTLDDRQLCRSLQAVRECRGQLQEDAKKGFALETNLHAIVRHATQQNVLSIVDTFRKGTLPEEGDALNDATAEAIEEFDVQESLNLADFEDGLLEDVDVEELTGLDDLDAAADDAGDGLGDLGDLGEDPIGPFEDGDSS